MSNPSTHFKSRCTMCCLVIFIYTMIYIYVYIWLFLMCALCVISRTKSFMVDTHRYLSAIDYKLTLLFVTDFEH